MKMVKMDGACSPHRTDEKCV